MTGTLATARPSVPAHPAAEQPAAAEHPAAAAPVIDVRDLSMAYKLYARPADVLKEALFGGVRHDTFWALRGVSLSVREGDRVGIVGPNGAGKSTLLQCITGNLTPTAGTVAVRGRISSLLSMVPAWNVDETGVQNIRFNLLVQGVPERAIPALTEEIADFTELGPFLFHPVKTYSTGMSARLAFAIATAVEPEILIVDEVLGTGDGYFAGKAYRRMQDFCARGRALLFVSHSTAAVQQMCNKVVWVQNGAVRLAGDADYVLKQYELDYRKAEDESLRASHLAAAGKRAAAVSEEEIPEEGTLRLRLVAADATYFAATHYVRRIAFTGTGADGAGAEGAGATVEVPIEFAQALGAGGAARLDFLGSEWGRVHERGGRLARVLARVTGRRVGGQFVVGAPGGAAGPAFEVVVEAQSSEPREALALEVFDTGEGRWRRLEADAPRNLGEGWRAFGFRGALEALPAERAAVAVERIVEASRPDVAIREVRVTAGAGEEPALMVREREPFAVRVRVHFERAPPLADVGIKISRADGVYVFWSSSGLSGVNLAAPRGERTVVFHFNPNELGAGEYYVNAHVMNGWDYPANYPHAEVFARQVNAASFRVAPELAGVDFGLLNRRVRVEVIEGAEGADAEGEDAEAPAPAAPAEARAAGAGR